MEKYEWLDLNNMSKKHAAKIIEYEKQYYAMMIVCKYHKKTYSIACVVIKKITNRARIVLKR